MEQPDQKPRNITSGRPVDYLRVVLERKWLIVAVLIVAVGLAMAYSLLQTPRYRATAAVLRESTALDQILFGTSIFELQDSQRQLQTGANLVKVTKVAQMVKEDTGSDRSAAALLYMIGVSIDSQADILRISAVSPNAEEAATVANSFARQFIKYRREANESVLAAADNKVVAELENMSPEELASERGVTLTQKHEELGILKNMQTGGFEIIQDASVPTSSFSPRPVRNAGFGFVGGLLLGIIIAFLVEYADRRIKDEEALEREFGLPVLANVPRVGRRWGERDGARSARVVGFSSMNSPFLEAFRTLRSNLRFYQLEHKTQVILITSGLPREGKTVTTINLAITLAMSGARVIVIEADLRRPMLGKYLQLDTRIGVSNVLTGASTFNESLQVIRVPNLVSQGNGTMQPHGEEPSLQKNLLCMASGPLPPNPSELLASQNMKDLIAAAAAHAEYVLVDTPPLLLVSDTLNLAEMADGVVIAARVNGTTIEEARDIRTMMERSGTRAYGVVANGVKKKRRGYYRGDYKGYYTPDSAS
jgi:polysaccharide biosynthesis transport protein